MFTGIAVTLFFHRGGGGDSPPQAPVSNFHDSWSTNRLVEISRHSPHPHFFFFFFASFRPWFTFIKWAQLAKFYLRACQHVSTTRSINFSFSSKQVTCFLSFFSVFKKTVYLDHRDEQIFSQLYAGWRDYPNSGVAAPTGGSLSRHFWPEDWGQTGLRGAR